MTYIKILNFVKNDILYLPLFNQLKSPKSLEIFSKLDIKKMDEEFIKE